MTSISEDAVEAAVRALRAGVPRDHRAAHLSHEETARTVLAAAMPHLMAPAFDYGWREGKGIPTPVDVETGQLLHNQSPVAWFNPYRSQA